MPQFPANQPLLACNEFRRARFHQDADSSTQAAHARTVLQMLLAQDGSTTRLCETLAASAISVQVFEQDMVDALPGQLHDALPGARFIRRLSSLVANGDVLLDSLSFIALEGLPEDIRRDLEQATIPIGHMLGRLWNRRQFRGQDAPLFEQLWQHTGLPDPAASRSYALVTPEGPRMVIGETFRRGLFTACLSGLAGDTGCGNTPPPRTVRESVASVSGE